MKTFDLTNKSSLLFSAQIRIAGDLENVKDNDVGYFSLTWTNLYLSGCNTFCMNFNTFV